MMKPLERVSAATTTGQFADRAAVAVVGESRPDVAREALKIARVEALSRPVLLVDLLGQGSALDDMVSDDDPHGVSDAARYGVSLARVARPVPNADSLFVVPGGTESPLADDVLSDHLWASWSEQCRRAGALLVVAAPADLPSVSRAIDQLDGLVMVGDAVAPTTHAPIIGRLPADRRGTTPHAPAERTITPAEIEAIRQHQSAVVRRSVLIGALGLVAVATGFGLWYAQGSIWRSSAGETVDRGNQPIVVPGDPVTEVAAASGIAPPASPAAAWSVELASVNSYGGAMTRVRQVLDSLPVPTFARSAAGGGAASWYVLFAGAFDTREAADSLLTVLRGRGVLGMAAGRVIQAPFAWRLAERVPDEQLAAQLFVWRQQGLPAYALVDAAGTANIYFGAFETESDALLMSPMLDSLNLYATLTTRVGRIR